MQIINKIIPILFTFLFFNQLCGIEFEASGILEYISFDKTCDRYKSRFDVYVKDKTWYFKYYSYYPNLPSGIIECGYDGSYMYFINDLVLSNVNYYSAHIRNLPIFPLGPCDGGQMLWVTFCSSEYFSSLKTNLIHPVFALFTPTYEDLKNKIPAHIKYISNSNKLVSSFDYFISNPSYNSSLYIKYEVLKFTNINNDFIPIKASAYRIFIFNNENYKYITDGIYSVYVDKVNPKCTIDDFKPKIKKEIEIFDSRFEMTPGMPKESFRYRTTNWLSDLEFINHPVFKSAIKRKLELESGVKQKEDLMY